MSILPLHKGASVLPLVASPRLRRHKALPRLGAAVLLTLAALLALAAAFTTHCPWKTPTTASAGAPPPPASHRRRLQDGRDQWTQPAAAANEKEAEQAREFETAESETEGQETETTEPDAAAAQNDTDDATVAEQSGTATSTDAATKPDDATVAEQSGTATSPDADGQSESQARSGGNTEGQEGEATKPDDAAAVQNVANDAAVAGEIDPCPQFAHDDCARRNEAAASAGIPSSRWMLWSVDPAICECVVLATPSPFDRSGDTPCRGDGAQGDACKAFVLAWCGFNAHDYCSAISEAAATSHSIGEDGGDNATAESSPCAPLCLVGVCDGWEDAEKQACRECADCMRGFEKEIWESREDLEVVPEECAEWCPPGLCDGPEAAWKVECRQCADCMRGFEEDAGKQQQGKWDDKERSEAHDEEHGSDGRAGADTREAVSERTHSGTNQFFSGADSGTDGASAPMKELGFCVSAEGHDVNHRVERQPGTSESDDACLAWCQAQQGGATGCERIVRQGNHGCYLHRAPEIARGNSATNHVCWIFALDSRGITAEPHPAPPGFELPHEVPFEGSVDSLEEVGGPKGMRGWTPFYSSGDRYGALDIGRTRFETLLAASASGLIRRECADCAPSHRVIYYRRITALEHDGSVVGTQNHAGDGAVVGVGPEFELHRALLDTWVSKRNEMHVDFELYSSLEDARAGTHPWQFCNYDEPGVGFPRDCSPTHFTGHQWNSLPDSRHAGSRRRDLRFSVEAPRAVLRAFEREKQQAARDKRALRKGAQELMRTLRDESGVAGVFRLWDEDADGALTAKEFADFAARVVPKRLYAGADSDE